MSGPVRPLGWSRRQRNGMRRAYVGDHVWLAWLVDGRWLLDRDGYELGQYDTWAEVETRVREETDRG